MTDNLSSIEHSIINCKKCKLCKNPKSIHNGLTSASIFIVGAAPSATEQNIGIPFVGPAGQLLEKTIKLIGWNIENIFMSNAVRCQLYQDKAPKPSEIFACREFLRREILLIRPKVIVCLGDTAASALIHDDFKTIKQHGQIFRYENIITIPVYHPTYILRRTGADLDKVKVEFWNDFLLINSIINKEEQR